jgi:hypothetical protein
VQLPGHPNRPADPARLAAVQLHVVLVRELERLHVRRLPGRRTTLLALTADQVPLRVLVAAPLAVRLTLAGPGPHGTNIRSATDESVTAEDVRMAPGTGYGLASKGHPSWRPYRTPPRKTPTTSDGVSDHKSTPSSQGYGTCGRPSAHHKLGYRRIRSRLSQQRTRPNGGDRRGTSTSRTTPRRSSS